MTDADRKEFGEAIGAMAVTFSRTVDAALIRGYWIGLSDLTLSAVNRAVQRAIRTCRFLPTVAEIRELAGVLTPAALAVKAWDLAARAVSEHGGYASVDFADRTVNAVIRTLGGWERFCNINPAEFETWTRKEFLRLYEQLATHGQVGSDEAAPLMGIHERTNRFQGTPVAEPLRIGASYLPESPPRLPQRPAAIATALIPEFPKP